MGAERLKESVLGVVGDAAQNCPLPRRILVLPKRDVTKRVSSGSLYQINHAKLLPDAPTVLYSLRAVLVTAKCEQSVTIRFPSVQSLQAFFAKADRVAISSIMCPTMDEKYVMGSKLAVQVLGDEIPSREYAEHRHSKIFWLIKCFETQHLGTSPSVNGASVAAESNAKNGTCLSMLQRSGISWGSRQIQLVKSSVVKQPDDADEAISSLAHGDDKDVVKEEEYHDVEVKLEESPDIKLKDIIQYSRKRKCGRPVRSQHKKIQRNTKPLEIITKLELNKGDRVDRWSARRYEAAAKELAEVLKANKAFYGHPIARATLRSEARKKIGDTGLLDHLLKHLAGKVVPLGGHDRLRRRCDADGKMEYWLESADLVNIRKEAGIKDPYWTPPHGWKRGDCINSHTCVCCNEVRVLKDELSNVRRTLTELKFKDEKQQTITLVPPESASSSGRFEIANLNAKNAKESYELLVEKKSLLEEQLHKISKALAELEDDMKKLSSKTEVEAIQKSLRITYSKNCTVEEMNDTNRTSTQDLVEETSEESSDDDDDDNDIDDDDDNDIDDDDDDERESHLDKILRPIRLRACRRANKIVNLTPDAVDCSMEDLMVATPPSTSPHSTTTS